MSDKKIHDSKLNQEKKQIKGKKVVVKDNNKLILSLIVILLYFVWPQIVNIIKKSLSISDANSVAFDIILNIVLIAILIFIYYKDLK